MRITMEDLSKELNVSTCTISHVLNNTGRVSQDVRNKVLNFVNKKGYVFNTNARNLRKKIKGCVGIFANNINYIKNSTFFSHLIAGVLSSINKLEMQLVICSIEDIQIYTDMDVAGAIFINPLENASFNDIISKMKVPYIIVGRPGKDLNINKNLLDADNFLASSLVYKNLISLGHKNILSVFADKDYTITLDQIAGSKKALSEAGIIFDYDKCIFNDYSLKSYYEDLIEKLKKYKNTTAIVAASDTQAISVINTLIKENYRVPEDISVSCLANTIYTEVYNPAITGCEIDFFSLGEFVGKRINSLLLNESINSKDIILKPTFVFRKSVSAPKFY